MNYRLSSGPTSEEVSTNKGDNFMGAWFDSITIRSTEEKEVLRYFKRYCENAAHEDGHSYSGRLNMCPGVEFIDKTFDSYKDANEYVIEHAVKWENALAVKYKDRNGSIVTFIGGLCSS